MDACRIDRLFQSCDLNAAALGELLQSDAPIVSDIGALCQRRPSGTEPGFLMRVLGYREPGDGGGGVFRFDESTIASDGGLAFPSLDGGGTWKRVVKMQALSAEMFGAALETDASGAIQRLLDAAPGQGATAILSPNRTYLVDRAVWIKRDGVRFRGNGATIALRSGEIHGSVFNIANCENVRVQDLYIDVAERNQNGFTLCGNNTGFPELKEVGGRPVRDVVVENIHVRNARFHINRREAVIVADMVPEFVSGAIVDGVDGAGRPVEGTIVSASPAESLLVIDWRINRIQIGSPLEARGTGKGAKVVARKSVEVPEPFSRIPFASWHGKFGGKGISVQRACFDITIRGFTSRNCDIGMALEAHPPAPDNGMVDILLEDGIVANSARTALWVHSSAGQGTDAMKATLRRIKIVNPCSSDDRVGVLTFDRAANLRLDAVAIERMPTGKPGRHAVARGYFSDCIMDLSVRDEEAETVVDFRPHAAHGNAPGMPKAPAGNDSIVVTLHSKWRGGPLVVWQKGGLRPSGSRIRIASAVPGESLTCNLPRDPTSDVSVVLANPGGAVHTIADPDAAVVDVAPARRRLGRKFLRPRHAEGLRNSSNRRTEHDH